MRILFLEDDGCLSDETVEALNKKGHNAKSVKRIDQAKDRIKDNGYKSFDCIITDLNLNDEWLDEYQNESYGALLSGWVWLKHYVLNRSETKKFPA